MSASARWFGCLLVTGALAGAAFETAVRDPLRDDAALGRSLKEIPVERVQTAVRWMSGYGPVSRVYAAEATTKRRWARMEPSNTMSYRIGPNNRDEPVYSFLFVGEFEHVGPVLMGRGPAVSHFSAGRLVLLESGPPMVIELSDVRYPVDPGRAFDPAFDDR